MEMKNCCSSPRDNIDNELLARLLDEKEPSAGCYGTYQSQRIADRSSRCRRAQINVNPAVSCHNGSKPSCASDNARGEIAPDDSCGCDCNDEDCAKKNCLSAYPLAMCYTPDQEWRNLFEIEEAIFHGTIFRELELPFYPACRSCR